jgi:hypothetical protein
MPVPNIFGTATAAIPLSQLDTNFATPVTIGNTAVQLGNTVTSFGNVTLTNVTISSGNVSVSTATFGAGSNTAPSITTTGDTNTGIFFPAADTIAFSEGGVEAMRIDSSGNVGIGTDSPAYRLQVRRAGGAGSLGISIDGVGSVQRVAQYFAVGDSTSATTGHAFYARNGTATDNLAVLVDSSGNVGIGTSSPATALSVQNVRSDTAGTGWFTYTASATSGRRGMRVNANNGYCFDYYNGSAWSEQMQIDSSGNVGIGYTTPTVKLEVSDSTAEVVTTQIRAYGGTAANRIARLSFVSSGNYTWAVDGANNSMRFTQDGIDVLISTKVPLVVFTVKRLVVMLPLVVRLFVVRSQALRLPLIVIPLVVML